MLKHLIVFIIVNYKLFGTAENVKVSKLVTIAQGTIRGYKRNDSEIFEFFGIPYATAPTGNQKFTAPLPPPTWTQTLDAVDRGVICPQDPLEHPQKTMQEDCLIANIYAPKTNKTNLPVLVVIHQGGYAINYGHFLAPHPLVETKKLIAVTFNYRLGAHGFLCLGTKGAPGNAGLKDQLALLRWVKNNIANFGGNPNDITISGSSAGSSAAEILMLSKAAENSFDKVILESGPSVASWSVHMNPKYYAKKYATLLNFTNSDDTKALEEFYKTASYETLFSLSNYNDPSSVLFFSPCVEKNLGEERILDKAPINIIKENRYRKIPILYGFTNLEGSLRIPFYNEWVNKMNENFSNFLPADLEFETEAEKEAVAKTVKEFYFGNVSVSIMRFIDYFSDTMFNYPTLRSVKSQTEGGHESIYLYYYEFNEQTASTPSVSDILAGKIPGAGHCAQVTNMVYDKTELGNFEKSYSEEHIKMKSIMVELWTNFITSGKPVREGSFLPIWLPVSKDNSPYMHLSETIELRRTSLLPEVFQFWNQIYEQHYHHPIPPVL